MNFGTVTAVMKDPSKGSCVFAYWPWGMECPKMRNKEKKEASPCGGLLSRPLFYRTPVVKADWRIKGDRGYPWAKTIGVLFIGLAAREEGQQIGERTRKKARLLGKKLASSCRT